MSADAASLAERFENLGREIGDREAAHSSEVARARKVAEALHGVVGSALQRFHNAATDAGAPHVVVNLGAVRTDDKHLRAVEFDLERGRHRAIVTVKSRGDVTLVGPFHRGKTEGPCRTFPIEAEAEIESALASFIEKFIEEATSP